MAGIEEFTRTELLLGEAAMKRLANARVAVFGIGGVGGYVCEGLVRSGIGAFDLIDHDRVALSNLNRQIIATHTSVGQYKTDVMKERMLDISPQADIRVWRCFFLPENAGDFPFREFDYVVDAVDTVTAKIELILQAQRSHVPVISAMGAGNKLDPSRFQVADIYETSVCPLARIMRRELKKRGVRQLKVVYSTEPPRKPLQNIPREMAVTDQFSDDKPDHVHNDHQEIHTRQKITPGSTAFTPSVCGLLIASEVVKDLCKSVIM